MVLKMPAGSVVVLTDTVLHGSAPNLTRSVRRAWMAQFTRAPITWLSEGGVAPTQACGAAAAAEAERAAGVPVALAVPLSRLRA